MNSDGIFNIEDFKKVIDNLDKLTQYPVYIRNCFECGMTFVFSERKNNFLTCDQHKDYKENMIQPIRTHNGN